MSLLKTGSVVPKGTPFWNSNHERHCPVAPEPAKSPKSSAIPTTAHRTYGRSVARYRSRTWSSSENNLCGLVTLWTTHRLIRRTVENATPNTTPSNALIRICVQKTFVKPTSLNHSRSVYTVAKPPSRMRPTTATEIAMMDRRRERPRRDGMSTRTGAAYRQKHAGVTGLGLELEP